MLKIFYLNFIENFSNKISPKLKNPISPPQQLNLNQRLLSNEKCPNTSIIIEKASLNHHKQLNNDKNNNLSEFDLNQKKTKTSRKSFESNSFLTDPCPLMTVSTTSSIALKETQSNNKNHSKHNCHSIPNNSYPLVQPFQFSYSQSNIKLKLNEFNEKQLIHEQMERVQAEQLLNAMQIGNFLLRRRTEGNLALSLRSVDGWFFFKSIF